MVETMQPIVKKIFRKQKHNPIHDRVANFHPAMPPAVVQDQKVNGPNEKVDTTIHQHQVYVGGSIFKRVEFTMPVIANQHF
jgi:hypothetical protein